jgi:predicted Zn-dependent protease
MRVRIAYPIVAVLFAGCAGPSTHVPGISTDEVAAEQLRQQTFQIQNQAKQGARLANVAHRVFVANRTDCGSNIGPRAGFTALAAADVPELTRPITIPALNLDAEHPTVVSVVDNGPAARAGMQSGDVLLAVDGHTVPSSNFSSWMDDRLKKSGSRVQIDFARKSQKKTVQVAPVIACSFPILFANDSEINAATDGKVIVIHAGIMRVAQSDAELALVVGHELAHVTMAHIQKQKQNQVAGAAGGLAVDVLFALGGVNTGGAFARHGQVSGATAFATAFEKEADYVGTYYAARAGYDVASGERFWRAMAQENPKQIFFAGLHPTSPERFVQMQKTLAELNGKRQRNLPLNPEMKSLQASAETSLADHSAAQ